MWKTLERDMDHQIVAIIVAALLIVLVVLLGGLPGHIARKRGHPSADAVAVAGWIGIFTFGIIWLIALIWAHAGPDNGRRITRATGRRVVARRGCSRDDDAVDALEQLGG